MVDEAAIDREELRRTLERRITRRKLQIAQRGIDAPNDAIEDLAQAERDLAALDVVDRPPVSQNVIEVVPAADRERYTMAALLDLIAQVAETKKLLAEMQEQIISDRARDYQERIERQRETDDYRIELERRLGNVRAGLLVNAVATVLGWVFRRRL